MALIIADRVKETTSTTGTGSVSLGGASTGFQAFSTIGNGNSTYYTIAGQGTTEWEVGIGTYTSAGNTLSRDTVLSSSNSGSKVVFSSGVKDVFLTQPAERSLLIQSAGSGLFSSNSAFTANGVVYANSASALTTGSALTFNGTSLGVGSTASVTGGTTVTIFGGANPSELNMTRTTGADFNIITGASFAQLGTQTNYPISFIQNGSEQMRLTSTGLGIGTSSPGTKLEAVGVIRASSGTGQLNTGITGGIPYIQGYDSVTSGNSQIAFYTNTERMRLDSSGNLGIGTSSPSAKLNVAGSAATNTKLIDCTGTTTGGMYQRFTNTGGGLVLGIESSAGGYLITGSGAYESAISSNNTSMNFSTNNGSSIQMRLNSSGNLGIGTSSPVTTLDVTGIATVRNNSAAFNTTPNTNYGLNFQAASTGVTYITSYSSGGSTSLAFATNSGGAAAVEAARFDSSGNMGIGTSSPSTFGKLAVTAASGVIGNFESTQSATNANLLNLNATQTNSSAGIRFQINSGTTAQARIQCNGDGAIVFQQTSSDTERMRIDSSGYLLVGYTSSNGAYKLQVNSQIFATSSTIATSDGKYKENVQTLDGALDLVKALRPVQFSWKQHPVHAFDTTTPTVGFIAQEVQQVLADKPYLNSIIKSNECVIEPEEKDEEGNVTKEAVKEEFLGIAEGNMIALLTKALQEQQIMIEQLKTEVSALKGA